MVLVALCCKVCCICSLRCENDLWILSCSSLFRKRRDRPHMGWERESRVKELRKKMGWGIGERGSVLLEQLSCSWNLLFNGNPWSLPNYTPASWYEPWCRPSLTHSLSCFSFWLDTLLRRLLCKERPLVSETQQRGKSVKIPCTHSFFLFLFHWVYLAYLWTSTGVTLMLSVTAGVYRGEYSWESLLSTPYQGLYFVPLISEP